MRGMNAIQICNIIGVGFHYTQSHSLISFPQIFIQDIKPQSKLHSFHAHIQCTLLAVILNNFAILLTN